jgi:hypothetical protein
MDQLAPYVESISRLDPAVCVDVQGPSETGVCLVTITSPILRSGDVDAALGELDQEYPGAILSVEG